MKCDSTNESQAYHFAQIDAIEVKEVIIIGAGASGIAAGRYFIDNALLSKEQFLILEARDRIGGRTHTRYDISDYPLELGAEFIHGENAITHQFLNRYHLSTLPAPRYCKPVYLLCVVNVITGRRTCGGVLRIPKQFTWISCKEKTNI
jgi:phytoene dehydrogenase-like protein